MQKEKFDAQAIVFIESLMSKYFNERDLGTIGAMRHPEFMLISSGGDEFHCDYDCVTSLPDRSRTVVEQSYQARELDRDRHSCLVWGEIKFRIDENHIDAEARELRISAICVWEESAFLLYHMHCSIVRSDCRAENFSFERLMDDIVGGVQICAFNDDFTIEYINAGFSQMTGYSQEELLGRSHMSFVWPEDLERLNYDVKTHGSENGHFSSEYRLLHKNGTCIWVLDKGTLLYRNGKPEKIQSILTDITLHRQREEERRVDEMRYQTVFRQLDAAMFDYNIVTKQLTLYENDANLYAVPNVVENGPETLIQIGAIRPDFAAEYREMYRKIHAGEPFANCFINTMDTDNIIHEYELSLTTIYDSDHKPIRAIGMKRDVSLVRRLQREQKFSETMVQNKKFVFEANVTENKVLYAAAEWRPEEHGLELPFDELITCIADQVVEPEYKGHVLQHLSAQYICDTYAKGQSLMVFCYKRRADVQEYQWYEATINIVQDEYSGSISIRMYITNINELKKKELEAEKERLLYESMVANAIQAYEINLTQDIFIKGYEAWEELYGIEISNNYNAMITAFCRQAVHADDRDSFLAAMDRASLMQAFNGSKRQVACEYRKQDISGAQRWVTCTTHLYEDPDNGEIRGYCYVEDIDKEKREDLALKYRAEHDYLTGLFNKETSTQLIKHILKSSGKQDKHALMVLDIDYFKNINDSFGHMFGDKVIKEIGGTIRSVFCDGDIVGRVGGDEFCVFIVNRDSEEEILKKAQQLCDSVRRSYDRGSVSSRISASVGVAIYPQDGISFEELFRKADKRLYVAKGNGRDRYVFRF